MGMQYWYMYKHDDDQDKNDENKYVTIKNYLDKRETNKY
jgi:hypothetical protein